jgi:hypothetical protein
MKEDAPDQGVVLMLMEAMRLFWPAFGGSYGRDRFRDRRVAGNGQEGRRPAPHTKVILSVGWHSACSGHMLE